MTELAVVVYLPPTDVHRICDVDVDTRLILSNSARFLVLFKMVERVDALKDLLKA